MGGKRMAVTVLVAVLFVFVLMPLLLGLALRGQTLVWLAQRASRSSCGDLKVSGGHVGVLGPLRMLLGWGTTVHLRDVELRDPEGRIVLAARSIELRVAATIYPHRLTIKDALISDGAWRLVSPGPGQRAGFFRAFATSMCAPTATPVAPKRPAEPKVAVAIQRARLVNMDVELSFQAWGMRLAGASGDATLSVAPYRGRTIVPFSVKRITAGSSELRIGKRDSPTTPRFPFDRVAIAEVTVDPNRPEDLLLVVTGGQTGRALLRGRATFLDVFAPPQTPPRPAGMDLAASWDRFGDLLPALLARWGVTLADPAPFAGNLRADLHGPFNALLGAARFAGPHVDLAFARPQAANALVQTRLTGFPTQALLPRKDARFAGTLDGRLAASARLGRRGLVSAEVEALSLDLVREARDELPRVLLVRGPGARPASARTGRLALELARLGYENGRAELAGLAVSWPGLVIRDGSASWPLGGSGKAAARLGHVVIDPGRWSRAARGRLAFSARARGTADALALTLNFDPASKVVAANDRLTPPRLLALRLLDRKTVVLDPARIRSATGGAVTISGRLSREGPIDARVGIERYPLGALAGTVVPAEHRRLVEPLGGTLAGAVAIRGTTRAPTLDGQVALSNVRVRGASLGNGGLRFATGARGDTVSFDGRVVDALAIQGAARLGSGGFVDAHAQLAGLPLEGLLPTRVPRRLRRVQAFGDVDVRWTNGGGPSLSADVRLAGPALTLVARGRRTADGTSLRLDGRVVASPLAELSRGALRASGLLAFEARVNATGPRVRPQDVRASVLTAGPVVVSSTAVPLVPVVQGGSRLSFDGTSVHVDGLRLYGDGLSAVLLGKATVDWAAPRRTRLDLRLEGSLDARSLSRSERIRRASGTLSLLARVTGTMDAPNVHADVAASQLSLEGPTFEVVRGLTIDGIVQMRGLTISTQGLTIAPGLGGELVVGPERPLRLVLRSLRPFRPERLVGEVVPRGARTVGPLGRVRVGGVEFDLRVRRLGERELEVAGVIELERGYIDLARRAAEERVRGAGVIPEEARHIHLDLELKAPGDALVLGMPVVPDVVLSVHCHVRGTLAAPELEGRIRGDGPWSSLLLWGADLFSARDLRGCEVLPAAKGPSGGGGTTAARP